MKFFNMIPSSDGTACLLLYGPVGQGEKVDASEVVSELLALEQQFSKIDIRINSLGGEVFSGIAIFNALSSSKADITIYVDGVAASIAGIIALCGKPLYMSSHARLMLHRVSGGEWGDAEQLRKAASMMESLERTLAGMIASRCKTTAEQVRTTYFDGVDHWLSASEALERGLIDGVYDIADEDAPDESASTDDIYQFFTNRLAIQSQSKDKNMAFIDDLRVRPSFQNATTEEQLMAEIANMENQAAKVPALESRVAELTEQLSQMQRAGHEAILNQAVAEGKITPTQKPMFLSLLVADEQNTKDLLNSLPARKPSVEQYINGGAPKGGSELLAMSWDEIDKAGRLAELKNQYPDAYKEKFKETFCNNN